MEKRKKYPKKPGWKNSTVGLCPTTEIDLAGRNVTLKQPVRPQPDSSKESLEEVVESKKNPK